MRQGVSNVLLLRIDSQGPRDSECSGGFGIAVAQSLLIGWCPTLFARLPHSKLISLQLETTGRREEGVLTGWVVIHVR